MYITDRIYFHAKNINNKINRYVQHMLHVHVCGQNTQIHTYEHLFY